MQTRTYTVTGMDMSGYMCKDAPRALAFYSDIFGVQPSRVYPEDRGGEFDLPDGSTFGLWGGGGYSNYPFQPNNSVLFAVDDIEAAAESLRARGSELRSLDFPNCRMLMFPDTEGNTVTLHKRKS